MENGGIIDFQGKNKLPREAKNIKIEDYEKRLEALEKGGGGSGVEVVQETGQSTTAVMSQKATTDALANKQNTLQAGSNITIEDNTINATDTTYSNFVGTDGETAGTAGLVPAPTTSDGNKFLKSDGTWTPETTYSNFAGTDGQTAGTAGLVPAPATTDAGKVLSASGSWITPDAGIKTLTTDDYNYPTTGTKTEIALWLLQPGAYIIAEGVAYEMMFNSGAITAKNDFVAINKNNSNLMSILALPRGYQGTLVYVDNGGRRTDSRNFSTKTFLQLMARADIVDALNSTSALDPLSANQGRVLNSKIEGRIKTNAGAPTTSTTGTKGQLLEDTTNGNLYICTNSASPYAWKQIDKDEILTNAGAPTTSTAGTLGQLLTDTTNAKLYQLTAIDNTDPQNPSYTWSEVGGGSGPTVVQTTGTSTTDVMSQAAASRMIYTSGHEATKDAINIGTGSCSGANGVQIGNGTTGGTNGIHIGSGYGTASASNALSFQSGKADGARSVAFSYGETSTQGVFQIGLNNSVAQTYGYNNSAYRLLTGLYDPQSAHDAATKGYVDTAILNGGITAPTTATVGSVGTLYSCVNNGTPEIYMCTDTTGGSYTWVKV